MIGGEVQHRLHVLREAAAAVADAREQKRAADAPVGGDGQTHEIDVRADGLADIGDFVHERDARGEHRVRRVLAEFGAGAIHHHDRRAGSGERRIQLAHHVGGAGILGADHDAIGLHEVVDRGTLLQKLRIAHDAERMGGFPPDDLADALRRPDGNGALVDDDLVAVHGLRDVTRDSHDMLEVRRAILPGRRADGYENDLRVADALGQRRGEGQPLLGTIPADHFLEAGLVDGYLSPLEHADLRSIAVNADDIVPVLS